MRINTLELTNVRGFTHAKLEFQPGFNLIVGINGVGKTTVLESLRIVLSHILYEIKAPVVTRESFKKSDININTSQLQVNTNFSIDNVDYDFIYSKSSSDVYFKEVESNTSQNKELRRDIEAQKSILAQKAVDLRRLQEAANVSMAIHLLVKEGIIVEFSNDDLYNILHSENLKNLTDNDNLFFLKSLSELELSNSLKLLDENKNYLNSIEILTEEIKKLTELINSNAVPSRKEGIKQEDSAKFILGISRNNTNNLLGIYYSTRRSLMVNQITKITKSKLQHAPAYIDTLSEVRSFNVKMFAEWFRSQKVLAAENPTTLKYKRTIEILEKTIYAFLPGFSDLELVEDEISKDLTFSIIKDEKRLLFSQLSDGERGVLALVFDIARRLIIANIDNENPLDGEAIILIDELDLHLHPKWQRTIVNDLVRTFPNCQFIATTHSPQIISSIYPERINIIKNFDIDHTVKTYGLDINYILKFVMEDDDRLDISNKAIESVQNLIDEMEFEKARDLIAKFKSENLDLSEWTDFEAQMSHLEMFGDEENN